VCAARTDVNYWDLRSAMQEMSLDLPTLLEFHQKYGEIPFAKGKRSNPTAKANL
jgi:hypothetical protein